ncbi:MAG: patatin-like phospholipase family protein [Bacteroidetes bacterium]|nr:patatin-like phospholipase family protein [Bacteroidota bacterium]
MKLLAKNIFYSFPVQLFILHFRKYQILLFFWFILLSTINSQFLKNFGADALFFSPEYLGKVNLWGALFTGIALGVFIMSWNVTTFILHTKRFKFLATTATPFFKYCLNNAILPLLFIIFYFVRLYKFDDYRELMSTGEILTLLAGITLGLIILFFVSFIYFFRAEKIIVKKMAPIVGNPELFKKTFTGKHHSDEFGLKVSYYISGRFSPRKVRSVQHYRQDFIDAIFKSHHIAAIMSMLLSFVFLVLVGFLLENKYFEMPASASILVFFAIMIALIGALTYFLQSWSLPAAILLFAFLNFLYKKEIIDPRNKAYGLNYTKQNNRAAYNKASLQHLCSPANIAADKKAMIETLNKWKANQQEEKPLIFFVNVSGGGLRSATFVMNALQKLDSMSGGQIMKHTFLISGASGGMLAATYYRELTRARLKDPSLNLNQPSYTDNISRDLLNPVFTSMIARDIFAPVQKFRVGEYEYVKDRGYAFEKKLSDNTKGLLNVQLNDVREDEANGRVPLIIFNSVIKSDGRKMVISSLPMSFMMKPSFLEADSTANPDAVDFSALFKNENPGNLRVLTALRMNATFPYILPNVWLPSDPVIDVMDAGLRDNFGQETTLRFIDHFKDWIKENTSGVVILQLRDRLNDNWMQPFETNSISDMMVTPATMLQHNWFKLQDYFQADQYNYYKQSHDTAIKRITIMYMPQDVEKGAALNFHLSAREKRDIGQCFTTPYNKEALKEVTDLLKGIDRIKSDNKTDTISRIMPAP